jgi:NADPH-dependent glutamate synthase beta subunit-like oxidoreductase/Fe-S oxidoreductase
MMTESKDVERDEERSKIYNEVINKVISNANYCYDCNRCVNVCPTSLSGIFFPRKLITDLTFLPLEEALKNNNIWNCLTCGQCMEYCPMFKENTGVDFVEIIKNLRKLTSESEILQEEQFDCHHGRTYSSLPELMAEDNVEIKNKLGFLDYSDLEFTSKGEVGYFMGCLPFMNSVPPCSNACPAGVDVQGYISLIAQRKFQEAIDLIRQNNPFPMVCARVCTEPCALECNRKDIDEALGIRSLKRFLADWELNNESQSSIKPVKQDKEKVAIIGAGPGGLSAAYFLARKGYRPTVFEAEIYKGGTLRSGIPRYRLPAYILDYEVEFIEKMGVEIKLNTPIGPKLSFKDLEKKGYKAFFISIGQQTCLGLTMEGENLKNVLCGLNFLKAKNVTKKEFDFEDKIIGVVGGGNVAMDSARTALRLGAKKVVVIYRRSEKEMPASEEEIEMAREENVEFQFLTNPVSAIGNDDGTLKEVECIRMELGEPDKSGRRRPIPIEGSEFRMDINYLILAIGQGTELTLLDAAHDELQIDRWGKIMTNELTMQTNVPNIFAGGDVIPGEGIVVRAIGNGNNAATSIDRYLRGIDLTKNRIIRKNAKIAPIPKKEASKMPKECMDLIPLKERLRSFNEVELPLTEESAIQEASRCLNCNICCSPDQKYDVYVNSCDESNLQECNYGIQPVIPYYNALDFLSIPRTVIGLLNHKQIVPVVLSNEKCCGHDSLWRGDIRSFEKLARHNVKLYNDAGVKTLIFSCAEGFYTWKYEYPKLFEGTDEFNFEIYHISEYILKEHLLDDVKFPVSRKIKVTYHDACRLGRLGNVYDAPRDVLNKIPFIELIEMESNRKDALCCGVSAYISCNEYSREIQAARIQEAIDTGAEYLIVSCPKCLAHFNCYLDEHLELKNKLQVIDLTSFLGKLLFLN